MKIKILLIASIILTQAGCKTRDEVLNVQSNVVDFKNGYVMELPKLRNSEKRGFADITCDGIDDMIEINDEKFIGQEYKLNVFEGYVEDGKIKYKDKKIVDIDIELHTWSSQFKMDTADINGDGCADVVFSDISTSWKDVNIRLEAAMNLGDFRFSSRTTKLKMNNNQDFNYYFKELVKDVSLSEDESLSDYVKMDWADWDANGSDDFMIFVDDNHSLDLGIFLTEKSHSLNPTFVETENVWAKNFMHGINAYNIDVEDVTGDGHADVLVYVNYKKKDGYYYERYAVAIYDEGELSIEKDKILKVKAEIDFFTKAKKRDITDMTNDGKADIVYVTESDDKPVMLIWEAI